MKSLIKNKKALGPIGAIMLFGVFLIIWFVWLGGWVAQMGHLAVTENNLTGVEAFFFDNLNLVIMVFMTLGMLAWSYFGGSQ